MTHKVHPYSSRLTITKDWKSRWFDLKNYQKNVNEDYVIRVYIYDKFKNAGVANLEIERFAKSLSVIIYTSRPGILIGRGGTGVEEIKRDLIKLLNKKVYKYLKVFDEEAKDENLLPEIRIEIREVRNIDTHARLVALNIAEQLERRIPFRRVIKRALDRVVASKEVKGAKIMVKGRLNGTEMARAEFVKDGSLPLQTLRADIDYAFVEANTKYGVISVKVWIYKGEKLE